MSFGRNKNMVRRAHRPDGQFHRLKRRRRLDTRLAVGGESVWQSLLHVLRTALRKR